MLARTEERLAPTPCPAPRRSLRHRQRNGRVDLLPKGQHLLLVGRIAVRLNETAGPVGQSLSIPARHVSDLRGDELRDVSDPTFLHIERQDLNRSSVLPV